MATPALKVAVIGATGGSGRAAVEALLAAGHQVTAFARTAGRLKGISDRLTTIDGDATRPEDVARAVQGQDAVVVTLGISESALRVRLLGPKQTPLDIRSRGTRNVIAAMQSHGVQRLVVQTSYGVGETRNRLPLGFRLIFALLLKPQIADTEAQERAVRASGLDWVLVQPVSLTDATGSGDLLASTEGATRTMKISRRAVGRFLAEAATSDGYSGRTVALSAATVRAARPVRAVKGSTL